MHQKIKNQIKKNLEENLEIKVKIILRYIRKDKKNIIRLMLLNLRIKERILTMNLLK